jgi:iron complex outermembrane receptor protein
MQADLSVRGATFEQVQVLLDGIDVGDPQTGHHLLDLPLDLTDVARIEVLRGHGSALYGANAFGGAVNVVSRAPAADGGGRLAVTAGDRGTWSARGSLDLADPGDGGHRGARLSLRRFRTDGDGSGRDADAWTGTVRLRGAGRGSAGDVFLGYARRAFGARDFYAPTDAWERTEVLYGAARWRHDVSPRLSLEPRLHLRRHEDRFVLYREDPARYANDHVSRRGGGELRALLDAGRGLALAGGLEGVYEDIRSDGVRAGVSGPALGDHERRRTSLALELARVASPLRWQVGLRLDARSEFAPRLSRSAAVSWDVGRATLLRGSAGTSFRVPTFTEFHYRDPFNEGNPGLQPERGWAWDVGVRTRPGPFRLEGTFFERHERDLIEWARPLADTAEPWRALNIAKGRSRGAEISLAWRAPRGHALAVHATRLDRRSDLRADHAGKYDLVAPRHLLTASAVLVAESRLHLVLAGRYAEREGGGPDHAVAFVLDGRLVWTAGSWALSLQGTNLLDRRYEEIPGVVMPGRLVTVALETDL